MLPSTNCPKLTFVSSLRKDNLIDGSKVATIISCLTSTHAFEQGLSFGLEWTILTQDLPILPFTMGLIAITYVLSSWKKEQLNQALCYSLFDQLLFQSFGFSNKTQRFRVWPFQVSHMWYFWILSKASVSVDESWSAVYLGVYPQ